MKLLVNCNLRNPGANLGERSKGLARRSFRAKQYIVLLLMHVSLCFASPNKHVIGEHSAGAGLFSMVFSVLNHLIYCKKYNQTPVVHWRSEANPYFERDGYHGFHDVWEYYFEPVSDQKYAENDFVWRLYGAPDGKGIPIDTQSLEPYARSYVKKEIIDRYIKIKPLILANVDSFYQAYMANTFMIGVHIRGTDKSREVNRVETQRFIDIIRYLDGENVIFFIATDEQKVLDELQSLFPGKIVAYPSYRSLDGRAIHVHPAGNNRARLGEQALIEVLLLSRCSALIHTLSNFSFAALMFNPELKSILIN